MEEHVRVNHPELFPVYQNFEKNVMRADVFRYVVMHDLGGLYCDLDYEFLRPFPYGDSQVVLGEELTRENADDMRRIANYVFASVPGHPLWKDALDDLIRNPPSIKDLGDVTEATGPGFLSRIYAANADRYEGVTIMDKAVFSPQRSRGGDEGVRQIAAGAYGIHHAWGSWKERMSAYYLRRKIGRLLRR